VDFTAGMRRVAILLGVAGGVVGCVAGYPVAHELWRCRSAQERFESLMATPTIQKVAAAAREFQHDHALQLRSDTWSGEVEFDAKPGKINGGGLPETDIPATQTKQWKPVPIFKLSQQQRKAGVILVAVNLDGIKEVTVEYNGCVSALDLSNDDVVFPVEVPHLTAYLLLLLFPFGGFLVVWGGVRVLTWVGTGFVPPRA
jgi:hypothetical protein